MFPCKIPRLQLVLQQDFGQRVAFSQSGVDNMLSDSDFLRRIGFSDDFFFHVLEFAITKSLFGFMKCEEDSKN